MVLCAYVGRVLSICGVEVQRGRLMHTCPQVPAGPFQTLQAGGPAPAARWQ